MTNFKQPTEAEINEAAVNTCPDTLANWSQETMFEVGFADGVKWLQNYQPQQPVKQVRSADEVLIPYVQRPDEAPDYVFLFHALQAIREYASQFQTPAIGFDASLIEEMRPGDAYAEPQPNTISATSDIGKIVRDFVKQHPEMDSWDSFLSGATSQLNIDISIIEAYRDELDDKHNSYGSLVYSTEIKTLNYILTKLKKQP